MLLLTKLLNLKMMRKKKKKKKKRLLKKVGLTLLAQLGSIYYSLWCCDFHEFIHTCNTQIYCCKYALKFIFRLNPKLLQKK